MIDFDSDIIAASVEAVGGRCMMIECGNKEKLIRFIRIIILVILQEYQMRISQWYR